MPSASPNKKIYSIPNIDTRINTRINTLLLLLGGSHHGRHTKDSFITKIQTFSEFPFNPKHLTYQASS